MSRTPSRLVMPFSNVLTLPYREKLRATQLAGFSEMSIQPQEIKRIIAVEGLSLSDMRVMADDQGIRLSRLDPLCTWVPDWKATNFDEAFNVAHNTQPAEFFALAQGLGSSIMSLNAVFPRGRYSIAQLSEHFATIDCMAGENGLICDLEAIPMWGVGTIEEAWSIVRGSGSQTGGLVFDAVHFIRGGSSMEMLKAIPGDRIHCVQLNDGPLKLDAGVTLEEDCFRRRWPGSGEFPLVEMLQTLKNKAALREVCAEVFSFENAGKSAEELAHLSRGTLEPILEQAGITEDDIHPRMGR